MNSLKSGHKNKVIDQDNALNSIEVISVFDQNSKSLQQIMEETFICLLNSDIDNGPAARYTNINSR